MFLASLCMQVLALLPGEAPGGSHAFLVNGRLLQIPLGVFLIINNNY
jgi:hypothetical protein